MRGKTETLWKHPRWLRISHDIVQLIDDTMDVIGPDVSILTEILHDLGSSLHQRKVPTHYLAAMGKAILHAIVQVLEESIRMFSDWTELYAVLSHEMIRGMRLARERESLVPTTTN